MAEPDRFDEAAAVAVDDHDPLRRLRAVALVREELSVVERDAVEQAIAAGLTFTAIGAALGISRQAVCKKCAPDRPEPTPTERARVVAERQAMAERDQFIEDFAASYLEKVRRREEQQR